MQWIWLGLGGILTVLGGSIKAYAVSKSPAVFEYVFFSGPSYVLLIAGLVLIILGLGYDLLFEAARGPTAAETKP